MEFMSPLEQITAKAVLDKGLGLKPTAATQAIDSRFRPSTDP